MDEKVVNILTNNIFSYIENFEEDNFEALLQTLCNDIIDALNLKDFVRKLTFQEVYEPNLASKGSFTEDGSINICKKVIEKDLEDALEKTSGLTNDEIKIYRYLLYVKTIIHEIEHANQKKLLIEDKENNSLETLIIRLCEEDRNSVAYSCFYEYYPTERLAELKALRAIVKVIENIESKYDITLLSYHIKKKAIVEEFHNYYKYGLQGPTEHYLEFWGSGDISILKKAKTEKELPLEVRTLYGIEISRKEYESMLLKFGSYIDKIEEISSKRKK